MKRLRDFLQVRPGEGRLALLVVGVMGLTSAGYSLGSAGIEALFFTRYGVQHLPAMYMFLAVLSSLTALALTALLGRVPPATLYVAVPLAVVGALTGARLLLFSGASSLYPGLWLGKEVLNSLVGLLTWGLASAACDTRQAKRLFPLFGAGRILGSVVGSVSTGGLVFWLGTENLLLVWAAAMLAAFFLVRAVVAASPLARPTPRSAARRARRPPSVLVEMQRGFQTVRRLPLMRWISVAAVLFSVLYFSLALPFSRAAAANFPDERTLAGFLGLFNGVCTAAAFLASLLFANRLYARFGLLPMLLAFPLLYLVSFGVLAAWPLFALILAARLVQMVWLSGIADAAYQALFNAVPAEQRDQVRAFVGGVPEQAGTFLAGALLFVGDQAFTPQQLYLIGLVAAALTTLVLWRAGRAYAHALVAALRAGQPGPFLGAATPSGAFPLDAAAVTTALTALRDPQPGVRRMAADLLSYQPFAEKAVTEALVTTLHDPEAEVRAAVLRALARAPAATALLEIANCLQDVEAEVRLAAIETLRALAGFPRGLTAHLQPLLADPAVAVRTRAAAVLLTLGPHPEARDLLRRWAVLGEVEERVCALDALASWGDAEAFALIEAELEDLYAPVSVRCAAARALAACGVAAAGPLTTALADRDRGVVAAAASALAQIGAPALPHVVAALGRPEAEAGALATLQHLPISSAEPDLRRYIDQRFTAAIHYDLLWRDVAPQAQAERVRVLAEALSDAARQQALHALQAAGLLADHEVIAVAVEGLRSRAAGQQANALEALETLTSLARLRPMLHAWEPVDPEQAVVPLSQHLADLLNTESDGWLRASAALAAADCADAAVQAALEQRAQMDPDLLVRATAQFALGKAMHTLPTLSVMERLLCLRRVPLFADLTPVDLRQVAALASEQVFAEGDVLMEQGEAGDALFVLVAGEVRVLADGVEVARRGAGDVVGEMAVISQEPRMATLRAVGEVRALSLEQKDFEGLLRERPDVGLAVMRVLCQRVRETQAEALRARRPA